MMQHTEYQYSVLLLSYYIDAIKVTIGKGVKSLNGVTNRLDDSTILEETLEPKDKFQDTSNKYLTHKKGIEMSILQCEWLGRYFYRYNFLSIMYPGS